MKASTQTTTEKIGNDWPEFKLPKTFPTDIDENLAMGLDLGIGSCGQALICDRANSDCHIPGLPEFPERIAFLGVRAFDVPETHEQTGIKLKNPERRNKRHLRITTRRHANRMWEVRHLLKKHRLLPDDYPVDAELWKHPPTKGENPDFDKWKTWHAQMTKGQTGQDGPWVWRVKALDQKLAPLELAAVLIHLAKHRGFKSNRKSQAADEDGGKVLAALRDNRERMAKKGYRTIGEMFLNDPAFQDKKRNSSGAYTAVIYRKAQEKEVRTIFREQRKLCNSCITEELEADFLKLFNRQLPLQNAVNLLGNCPFEPSEKRGSRFAPSFELCRALQKLNTLSLILSNGVKVRLAEYVDAQNGGYQPFIDMFSTFEGTKSNPGRITWKDLRKIFGLEKEIAFADLPTPKKKKKKDGSEEPQSKASLENEDFITQSSANNAAKGSVLLRKAFGTSLWARIQTEAPEQLDKAAFALSFFEEIENEQNTPEFWGVINQMKHDGLDNEIIQAVKQDLCSDTPTLHKFAGGTSMSTKASRKLIPLLAKGTIYSEACKALYGDHRQTDFDFENITNPVVRSVVRECLKQTVHLINETGKIPGRICVEIARDLGKSINERNELDQGIRERTRNKNANRDNLTAELGRAPDADELLRYELWLEQSNTCPYCGKALCGDLTQVANSHDYQIDHILPRSRSHDNSYDNKVLVHTRCNQHKENRTPFEFHEIGNNDKDSSGWKQFVATVSGMAGLRRQKRRNLLNTTFADDENKFAARNLNDTRYISRLVTHYLQGIYTLAGEKPLTEKGSTRRVFVQPGHLTSIVRKAWGLENLKKSRNGQRLGDKHHAVDALVCALLSEGQRQFVTRCEQHERDAAAFAFRNITESYRRMEKENGQHRIPRHIPPPWKEFRNDVVTALDQFTVSRREIRKGRGSLHNDTAYSVQEKDGNKTVYARRHLVTLVRGKPTANLTLAQIDRVRGIHDERNQWLKNALTKWFENKCPLETEKMPHDPQGNVIKRVYIDQGKKSGRLYPHGYVTGGKQVRLDVFSETNKNGTKSYFLVPVYSYHLTGEKAPNRAISAHKDENEWPEISDTHQFEFSLWKNSRVEIKKKPSSQKPNGEHFIGLYSGINRDTGAFMVANPDNIQEQVQFSVKTGTLRFRRLETDRLGRISVVKKENRTWRGKTVT